MAVTLADRGLDTSTSTLKIETILLKRGLKADLEAYTGDIQPGEKVVELDTGRTKTGVKAKKWGNEENARLGKYSDLPYDDSLSIDADTNIATYNTGSKTLTISAANDSSKSASVAKLEAAIGAVKDYIDKAIDTEVIDGVTSNSFQGDISSGTFTDKNNETIEDQTKFAASLQDLVEVATRLRNLELITTVDGGEVKQQQSGSGE